MSPFVVIGILVIYFLLLVLISFLTSKESGNTAFFQAGRNSPWAVVAFGMIGASLSGVTFISIPGWVGQSGFSYFQVVLGYVVGYAVIIKFLLPLYYKLNLISIYGYLEQRFGWWAYKTGAFFFLVSRVIGSAFRLYLVAGVFQLAIFNHFNIPFWMASLITILLIWLYTFRSGIKTIVWTDTFQTFFMLLSLVMSIYMIKDALNLDWLALADTVYESSYSQIFFRDWTDNKNFYKQFFSGAFIAIVMTGLDQDMMQKNLTCRTLKDAQKNMWGLSLSLVVVNLIFLVLGALLYIFSAEKGIAVPAKSDDLFPFLALNHFSPVVGIVFIVGLVAAAYSSADSALTALTTSFCVDFLGLKADDKSENIRTRKFVHIGFSLLLFLVILVFEAINNESVISALFKIAGYTYGPLLGMFAFGIFTSRKVKNNISVMLICVVSPLICYLLNIYSEELLWGYKFGFELLILNGLFTFLGMLLISEKNV